MDTTKVTQLSKEMAAFSRQAAEDAKKVPQSAAPQILSAVIISLAGAFITDRTSCWEGG